MIRLFLEAYYEPQFSRHSHGFRPGRGCHTALREIHQTWKGTAWFVEGDITGCFDNLDHEVLLSILGERIHDNRFLRLLGNLLQAGYLEDWTYGRTLSGTPQGGVVSPILANISLDRLDQFVEHTLIPASTRGTTRKRNAVYRQLATAKRRAERHGDRESAARLRKQMVTLPSVDPADPDYRRLRYVRYADDFLLGFTGPKAEAEAIRQQLGAFLREHLKLELSPTKTLITHGRTGAALFLGYELTVLTANDRRTRRRSDGAPTRAATVVIGLRVPADVIRDKCRPYQQHGKARHRPERTNDQVHSIIARYDSEYRGVVQYYRLASNLHRFSRLRWLMEQSLIKTLAAKLRISGRQVRKRYTTRIQTERGPRVALQVSVPRDGKPPVVATWGRTTLHRDLSATLTDAPRCPWNARSEVVDRLLTERCACCGTPDQLEVHHIRALKDLRRPGRQEPPRWVQVLAARQRKTLVFCRACHSAIHAGRPTPPRENDHRVLESRMM